MSKHLRDQVARAIYEEPGTGADWSSLSDDRREGWRKDADRVIPIIAAEYAAVKAEKDRAQRACEQMGTRIELLEHILRLFPAALDAGRAPHLEEYDLARNILDTRQ